MSVIKDEKVEVVPAALVRDENENRIEPEQAPARKLLDVSAPPSIGESNLDPEKHQATEQDFRTFVSLEMTAGEMADGYAKPCHACRHFDRRRAYEWFKRAEASAEGRMVLDQFAAEHPDLERLGPRGCFKANGVCGPATEIAHETILMHQAATCPETIVVFETKARVPFGDHFVPRDSDDARNSGKARDSVLLPAAGISGAKVFVGGK